MSERRILQVGQEDWSKTVHLPHGVTWYYTTVERLSTYIEDLKLADREIKDWSQKNLPFDCVLLTSPASEKALSPLMSCVEAHALFQVAGLELMTQASNGLFRRKILRSLPASSSRQETLDYVIQNTFRNHYGDRLTVADMDVSPSFKGRINYKGNASLTFSGEYGQNFQPLFTYRYNIPTLSIATELWQEYVKVGSCELKLELLGFERGNLGKIVKVLTFSEADMCEAVVLEVDAGISHYAATFYARGEGEITFGALHKRYSRQGLGKFLLGGCTVSDDKRQEVNYYFNPGDMTPPLLVYFAGYRQAEGFEGFYMMKSFASPFLLISDPRLEGGCFYIGSDTYEENIKQIIQSSLDYLGFDGSQLLMTGISMGSYGAMYYASHFSPHAVVVSKPFTDLGKTVRGLKLKRPDDFETSADMLLAIMSASDEQALSGFTDRFWQSFKRGDFTKTSFAICYMIQDDYDDTAVHQVISYLADQDSHIYAKGYEGRHNDNTDAVVKWFLTQIGKILYHDFDRKGE